MPGNATDRSAASAAVQEQLNDLDVDLVGVVRLEDIEGTELWEQAKALLPSARSIVVMGMEVYGEFMELITTEKVMGAPNMNAMLREHTDYLGGCLTRAAYDVARASRCAGLKALPLGAHGPAVDGRTLTANLSFRDAAEAAGLGTIGMSGLLVTPQFGPRVSFSACLTEAELEPTPALSESACRFCNVCVAKCPSGALDFPDEGQVYSYNQFICRTYNDASGGCSQCMKQCPVASPTYG
jgi:epoxyqueuosine reductase